MIHARTAVPGIHGATGVVTSDPDASSDSERARLGEILEHAEACSELWIAVIEQAVRDLAWLQNAQGKTRFARHETATMRDVMYSDPVDFFNSEAFTGICEMLGAQPHVMRAHYGIDELLDKATAA